jgi:histidine phosphotransferase ChpT
VPGLVAGEMPGGTVDAHAIQPFFTGLLAQACGVKVAIEPQGDAIVLSTR